MAFKQTVLFEALGNILQKKSIELYNKHISDEELWKTFSKFMCLRYLTMSKDSNVRNIVVDNYLTLERMPEKQLYRWLIEKIPQQQNSFIRYIK